MDSLLVGRFDNEPNPNLLLIFGVGLAQARPITTQLMPVSSTFNTTLRDPLQGDWQGKAGEQDTKSKFTIHAHACTCMNNYCNGYCMHVTSK